MQFAPRPDNIIAFVSKVYPRPHFSLSSHELEGLVEDGCHIDQLIDKISKQNRKSRVRECKIVD